jgi:PAS domain S-box-containing protein
MLRSGDLDTALDSAGRRIAEVLGLRFALLSRETAEPSAHQVAVPLVDGYALLGTLLIPADVTKAQQQQARRLVPSLELLLAAASDREAINTALQGSRRDLERFFDVTSDLLYIGGGEYLKRVNPAFEQTFGYSSAELLNRPLIGLVHPADRDRTQAVLDTLIDRGGSAQFENRCIRRDGAERWLEWSMVSENGMLYGAARDVTDRRREQDRLRQAQRLIEASHAEVTALAEQQAALRRVATMVARGVHPSEVFPAAVSEVSHGLSVANVALVRYDTDDAVVVLAARPGQNASRLAVGERLSLDSDNTATLIRRAGAAARVDSFDDVVGSTGARMREMGIRSAVGAPILVNGRVWGALIIGSSECDSLPMDAEARVGDFADLVATAITNAENRAELTTSRARIVSAADQARRRFERDLHDGAQQRIVSLGLELRAIEASVPDDQIVLRDRISGVVTSLQGVSTELQEISRGIHPAILSRGGIGPAIKTLARRSPVPVNLELDVDRRLPEPVEVAAYYVVAEALTNAAKHAAATEVTVCVACRANALHLSISDDGIGGAGTGRGSGLVGLKDRVETLAGRLDISSRAGQGTTLVVTIPLR